MISYEKLFEILKRKNLKKTDLLKIISKGSLSKLNKNQNLQTEVIEKICNFLNVQPGEIMTFYKIIEMKKIEQDDLFLFKAGYKQKLTIYYPTEMDDIIGSPEFIEYASKNYHQDTEAIISGSIDIPNDFIPIELIQQKDPHYNRVLKSILAEKNENS